MEFKLRPWTKNDLESVTKNANNADIQKFMSDGFPDSLEKWKSFLAFAERNDSILYLAIQARFSKTVFKNDEFPDELIYAIRRKE